MAAEPLDLDAARATIKRALQLVQRLASGTERWKMSRPAQPEQDSDLVLAVALKTAGDALAELERYRATSERFTDPSVTEAMAREIWKVPLAPSCWECGAGVSACPRHIAEYLVNAMREERLVVLTVGTADDIIRNRQAVSDGS